MSIKQRLYPDPNQELWLVEHCHHARFVYNIGLEQRAMYRRDKHNRGSHPLYGVLDAAPLTVTTQMRQLTQLRGELDWLRSGSSSVQQAALRDLDRAFRNFWAGHAKYPRFKRKSDRSGGFAIRDLTVKRLNRRWGVITVPKVGGVRFRVSRPWSAIAAASSARVTHRNGRWHVCFTTPPPEKIVAESGARIGIDRGIANTLAISDGRMIQAPSLTRAEQRTFVRLQQRLDRQTRAAKLLGRPLRDCRRRNQTLHRLGVLRRRVVDRRTDWAEKATTKLARGYSLLAVEDLHVVNMVRRPEARRDPDRPDAFLPNGARAKAALNRAILANGWGRFVSRLEQKTPEGTVLRVDPKNTSRTCAVCGHCAAENRESQAVFCCVACGHIAHADTNAAVVILDRAIATLPSPDGYAAGYDRPATGVAGTSPSRERAPKSRKGSANQPAA